MKKIVFIAPTAWPLFTESPRAPGGAELDLFNIATALTKRNYDCLFLISHTGNYLPAQRDGVASRMTFYQLPFIGPLVNTLNLWRILWEERPSVVMVKGAGAIVFQVGLWSKITHTYFVWRASHEQNFDPSVIGRRSWYLLYRLGLTWANAILCQTQDQVQLLEKNFHQTGVVIYNGHKLPPQKELVPFESRQGIVWIGRTKAIKQPFVGLAMAKHFPATPFIMILGDGDEQLRQKVHNAARSLPNVTIHDTLSLVQTERLLSHGSLFVLTSLREGMPNVLLQALKWEVPVVSLHVNPDNLIKEANGGVYCRGSEQQMQQALEHILTNTVYARKLARAARKAAENYFSIDAILPQYERLIEDTA